MITEKEFRNLKVGDKVLLTSYKPYSWNWDGEMDKFLDKVVEISQVIKEIKCFKIVGETWMFSYRDTVKVISKDDRQEIHIYRKGNEVHAIEKKNGEVIDNSVAKCNPKDKFNFSIGATTAFKRLKSQESLLSVVESAKKTFEPYPWQVEAHKAFNNHNPQFIVCAESRLTPKVTNYTVNSNGNSISKDDLVKECNDMIEYFNKLTELQNEIASIPRLENQVAKESLIKNGTRVKVRSMDVFKEVTNSTQDAKFVCLDEYVDKCGEVYGFDKLRKDFQVLFDDNYMCAIDEKNGDLYFTKDNVEII